VAERDVPPEPCVGLTPANRNRLLRGSGCEHAYRRAVVAEVEKRIDVHDDLRSRFDRQLSSRHQIYRTRNVDSSRPRHFTPDLGVGHHRVLHVAATTTETLTDRASTTVTRGIVSFRNLTGIGIQRRADDVGVL